MFHILSDVECLNLSQGKANKTKKQMYGVVTPYFGTHRCALFFYASPRRIKLCSPTEVQALLG